MESNINLLQGILLLLVMSVTAVLLFRSFKLPPILGYLLVGTLTSSHALGWLPENHSIDFMGEVGVVFLLFAIGLEFSAKQFMAMRNTVLGLGGLQMIVSTFTGFILLKFLISAGKAPSLLRVRWRSLPPLLWLNNSLIKVSCNHVTANWHLAYYFSKILQ